MKKLYVLCLVTLAAVFVDVVFLHSGTRECSECPKVSIQYVKPSGGSLDGAVLDVTGTVVGFACTSEFRWVWIVLFSC